MGSASLIAASARGDGPNGFSFEASLIEPVMPYSRSSSSSGMPGGYGASRWIHSGTRSLMSIVLSRVLMAACSGGGIRAENLHGTGERRHARERALDARVGAMPAQIEEEHVLPGLAAERARL